MIDCHLHLQDERLGDPAAIMGATRRNGISCLVVNGTHPDDWGKVSRLAREFTEVIPSFGLHPWRVPDAPEDWAEILGERLRDFPLAGLGEAGLDRWIKGHDLERQKEVFAIQLELAASLGRPLTVHCLQAWGTLLECLRGADLSAGCLLHSYSGPAEMVRDFVDIGIYFSLSGYFFREGKEDKLQVFDLVPQDRILLETDAPEMMQPAQFIRCPLPDHAGALTNHPVNLVSIYDAFAKRRGITTEETVTRLRENFVSWCFRGTRAGYLSLFPSITG